MEILLIAEKCFWYGTAAAGFAILFNVPVRTIFIIWILGALGGLVRLVMINLETGPVLASFLGASVIGTLSIPAAHNKHAPPMVFAIPAVIPMVPGVFAYRTMLGFINLTGEVGEAYSMILNETVNNGVKTLFILMALAVGVAFPNFITRKESAKEFSLTKILRRTERISKNNTAK